MPDFSPMPNESDFMSYILGNVFNKLTNGGNPKMLGPNNFIAWEPVPVVMDKEAFDFASKGFFGATPKLEEMTDEAYADARASNKFGKFAYAEEFARLADQIPSMIPELDADGTRKFTIFSPHADHTKSNVYQDVLEYCVVKDSKIDPKVEKKLENLRKGIVTIKKLKNPDFDDTVIEHPEDNPKFIFQSFPSPQYVKYLEYEALWDTANAKLLNLQTKALNGDIDAMTEMNLNGQKFIIDEQEAMDRWDTLGYKSKIEKDMAKVAEIEGSNFISIKRRYQLELRAARRTGLGGMNTYFYSAPLPASTLANSAQWIEYKFKKSEYESTFSKTSHSWSAAASFLGLFGGAAEGSHSRINSDFNFNDFEMSFKIGKCYVSSPWLGTTFLKSRFWKYSENGKDLFDSQLVSDGNGNGMLPAVSTEFYFISELKIGFRKGSDSYKRTDDAVKAGGVVAYGPFVIGGSYGYEDTKVKSTGKREEQGLSSSGILLIGRKCNILELSPNPLPSIKDDEWVEVN